MVVHIDKIEGLSDTDVVHLRQQNLKTVDDLWARVGSDFDAGIKQVARASNVKEEVITVLLIADSLDQIRIKYRWLSFLKNDHARTYRLIKTLVIVIALAAAAYLSYRLSSNINLPQQIVVTNPQGIPAYRVIDKDDVASRTVLFRPTRTLSDPQTVVGSYALTKLEPNARIREGQILSATSLPQPYCRYLVSVPVEASSLGLAPKAGSQLKLLPLPDPANDKALPASLIDAVLLGVEQREGGPTIVVAVQSEEQINALVRGATIVGVITPVK